MAKLDRKDVKIFAENSKETLITEFRTEDSEGETASFSRDPDIIQNENYSQGWVNDTNNLNTKIYGEDLNAVNYVLSYLLKYLYENGIAEWKSTTTYYQNSICKVDSSLYLSLQNNNIGNDPTSTVSYWKLIPLENVSIEDAGSGFSIVKDVTDNVITFKTISVTGYGEITDDGDQLNIDIAGGGGGGSDDAYWGTIRGTITNQTDLMTLINLKQDIFTVDSPLVLTDEQHLTINKATSSVSGYLDYNDFNTFNGKQDTISATLPISITNNNIEIETADTSTTGVLSYIDWNTFNNKQNAINGLTITETSTTFDVVPKSSITTSNIGSLSYPFSNLYTSDVYSDNIVPITVDSNDNDSQTLTLNNLNIKFKPSSIASPGNKLYIDPVGAYPTYFGFNNAITSIKVSELIETPALRGINGSNISVEDSLIPTSTNKDLGSSSNAFSKGYISDVYTNNLHSITTNGTIQVQDNITVNYKKLNVIGANLEITNGIKIEFAYNYLNFTEDNKYTIGNGNRKAQAMFSYAFNGASDIRNKENVIDYKESVLNKLDKITPFTFNYKDDDSKTTRLGISAQELQEQEPLCVVGGKTKSGDEPLSIDLMQLIVFNMKAIKELNEKVKSLEARVEELEGNKKELEK